MLAYMHDNHECEAKFGHVMDEFSLHAVHKIQMVRSPLWDEITHQFNLWQYVRHEEPLNLAVSFLSMCVRGKY